MEFLKRMDMIKVKAKKIGNAQRMYLEYFYRELFNPKEGLIPRSLLRNKLMTNEVSLGLIPRSLLLT